MVVLGSRKPNYAHKRLQAKLDHLLHHHQKPEAESELVSFRAKLSDGLRGLIEDLNVQVVSFSWVEHGFRLLHGLNSAFNTLIEAVDYPMSKWGSALADEYFNYTLHLLDLFNSISSSLARLQAVRLSLVHALTSPTRLFKSTHHNHDHHQTRNWANEEETGRGDMGESDSCHGQERMVLQAVVEMKAVALWICRVVLCGLGGEMINKDSEVINEMMGHVIPLLVGLDSRVYGELMEVKEVNEMVAVLLLAAPLGEEAKEMQRKVEGFQSKLEDAVDEVNCLFSKVLASRDRLMDCFRSKKQ